MKIFSNKFERNFVVGLSALVIIITSIPIFVGYYNTPTDMEFNWITMCYNSADEASYFAWIKQAYDGNILFRNSYAVEEHKRIFLVSPSF